MLYKFVRIGQFKQRLCRKISSTDLLNNLPWAIICIGIILRLFKYLLNRSLWLDEASLALNIVNRSFSELLLKPLETSQVAPFGFLAIEKILILAFGNNEYALRLFPLLAGITSFFLFYYVSKRLIRSKAIPIALGLFSISGPLNYYSSEVKQYSSDVAIALLMYAIIFYNQSKKITFYRAILFGFIGATAIWFSYTAVFVLAGVGTVLTFCYLKEMEFSKIVRLSIAYSIWIASFVIYYSISLNNITSNIFLSNFWAMHFAPLPSLKFWEARWYIDTFFKILYDPVGISLVGIAALSFIVGCISMFQEKRKLFFLLLSPILFALLASGLHRYPFGGRVILFIVPNILLFIAEGTEQIIAKTRHTSPIIGITVICLLFFYPLYETGYHLIRPNFNQEIKPVMTYLKKHKQDKDVIYLYYSSHDAFKYYSKKLGFNETDYIVGIDSKQNWRNYINDLNKLRGNKRVWILFSHVCNWEGVDEDKFFLYYLDSVGERLDFYKSIGASVYLYDLSK